MVDLIENLLSRLDDDIENELESEINITMWNLKKI